MFFGPSQHRLVVMMTELLLVDPESCRVFFFVFFAEGLLRFEVDLELRWGGFLRGL